MRPAANIGFLFTEVAFLDRFERAAASGFGAVEFPWPDAPLRDVASAAGSAGVDVVQINAHAGDLAAGDRGYANDPARRSEWRRTVEAALDWSLRLGGAAINLLVGNRIADPATDLAVVEDNLRWAIRTARATGVTLLLEQLNHHDTPDYLVTRLDAAAALLYRLDPTVLRLQLDTYHVALMEGDVVAAIQRAAHVLGHVQLADVPGRHEPGTGSLPFPAILGTLQDIGYRGAVSFEYVPQAGTRPGLSWWTDAKRAGWCC